MALDRRKFLALTGGGVILAAGAGLGAVASRKPDRALQPWKDAGKTYTDPRKQALSFAILAPNPHNRQPWLVDLSQKDRVILNVDTNRLLPHTDPYSRQITIGLGCFLEVMRMAAAANGFRLEFDLFPEGHDSQALDQRPVAIVDFVSDPTVKADPLFSHVLERRSLKEPYDLNRPVDDDRMSDLLAVSIAGTKIGGSNSSQSVEALRALSRDAMTVEMETPRTLKESVDLFRIGKAEIEANPDGIDFSGPFFETIHFLGLFHREGSIDTQSSQFQQGMDAVLANTDTAMAHVWQVTQGNSRHDQINAGRDWVRINLAATERGLGIQPLSQALQEYPEMKPHYDAIHKRLAPEGGTVQMFARLGYAEPVPASPRWPLEAKIVKG